jgi:hypothetical protein
MHNEQVGYHVQRLLDFVALFLLLVVPVAGCAGSDFEQAVVATLPGRPNEVSAANTPVFETTPSPETLAA